MLSNSGTQLTMPVAPAYSNNGGFGNDGFGWIWILLIFAIFGWGGFGGGYGFGGAQGSTSVYEGYVLNNDFSQLSKQISDTYNMTDRKFEGIANGICSLGYDQLAQMNGINTNIMQGTNTLQAAVKDCCCQTQQNLADVKYTIGSASADTNYNIATQANMLDRTVSDKFCQTNFNNATNTRDIIDSQSAGTRAILDKLCQMESNAKDEKIADLQAKNFDLRLAASQEAQNNYLVSQLGYQCPKPAYVVQPPQQVSFATNCNGTATFSNTGCGCNQFYGTTIA